jgi:hypothetical protein
MRLRGTGWRGKGGHVLGIVAGVVFGLLSGAAFGQGQPSDMLIEPALYAVVGAPFTATVEWTSIETKPDGTQVHHRRVSRVLRDSAGRQRFEDGEDEAVYRPGAVPGVRLYDPTTHVFAQLDGVKGVAEVSPMGRTQAGQLVVPASGRVQRGSDGTEVPQPAVKLPDGVTQEPLPARDIAGFHTVGTRTTTTIPAKDGSPAVKVVDEVWESPVWRMPLMHIHDDPRQGRSEAQVTELVRGAPDAALFHPPAGYAINDWQLATGRRVVLAKPSPLPQPILDDNLAAAADRMDAAATAHAETLTPVHIRYELTMYDYKGQKHLASMESWRSADGYRYELHSDTYNEVHVTNVASRRQWETKEGIEPLRVMEFKSDEIQPAFAIRRLLRSGGTVPKLRPDTIAGMQLTCAGDSGSAVMCFDQATGFVMSAAMDADGVTYEGWQKVGWKYLASTVRVMHYKRMLVEAKLTVASTDFTADVFGRVDGLRELAPIREPGSAVAVSTAPQHKTLVRGASAKAKGSRGNAQVRAWVDDHGKVIRAEVEDADDEQLAAWALECAQKTVFAPERQNGLASGFEVNIFSTIGSAAAPRP